MSEIPTFKEFRDDGGSYEVTFDSEGRVNFNNDYLNASFYIKLKTDTFTLNDIFKAAYKHFLKHNKQYEDQKESLRRSMNMNCYSGGL